MSGNQLTEKEFKKTLCLHDAAPDLLKAVLSAIDAYKLLGIKPEQSCYKLALAARDKALGNA